MSTQRFYRYSGLAAMIGSVLGLINIPLLALAYFATADGAEFATAPQVATWVTVAKPLLHPLLSFATPDAVYNVYGAIVLPVFLGLLAGLLALHRRQAVHAGRLERIGFWVLFASLSLFILGAIGAYYIGAFYGAALDFSFFAFLLPGLATMLIGPTLFGIATLRAAVAPRLGAWLLIVGGLPGVILTRQLVGHNSGGFLLLYFAWFVLGYWLWSSKESQHQHIVVA
ncbi:MAG: hypothetical protein R3C14_31985 [Caldilineaceae bacterium]